MQRESLQLSSRKKIPTSQILYLESDRNYTVVHTKNDHKYMSGLTLKVLEKRILDTSFKRINKGLLINFQHFISISAESKEKYVCLTNGKSLPFSRRKFIDLKAYLESLTCR